MMRSVLVAFVLAAAACSGPGGKGDRSPFPIDPTQPFRLELGRGSGMEGLETVKLDQTGRAVLHRMQEEDRQGAHSRYWATATLQLSPEAVTEVLEAAESNRLTGLQRQYHDEKIADGSQWVLWVRQGEREKSVYFNNRFPPAITVFAEQLDAVLARAGLDKAEWRRVPDSEFRQHDRELWDSMHR